MMRNVVYQLLLLSRLLLCGLMGSNKSMCLSVNAIEGRPALPVTIK